MSSKLRKNIDLFCRIQSLLQGSFAKESSIFRELPKNTSIYYRSLKIEVSFAKEHYKRDCSLFYRALLQNLLQKRRLFSGSSLNTGVSIAP